MSNSAFLNEDVWGWLSPEQVSESITFKAADFSYDYDAEKPEAKKIMADKQIEGVSFLWNTLDQKGIALLADEVGMGKTFQALGVACMLWKVKPTARVLVIAPNESICNNWITEYSSFVNKHYKHNDNLVKNNIANGVIHKAEFCNDLEDFEWLNEEGWCQLQVVKMSSLSTTTRPSAKTWDEKRLGATEGGNNIRTAVLENAGQFDLLIIDESQYFRKYDGDSLRVATAQGLFGDGKDLTEADRLAKRVLLMTATPSHREPSDIQGMVKYFDKELARKQPQDILKEIGLRRFRLLAGKDDKSFNKYHYRSEHVLPADFIKDEGRDIDAELFFALYQKLLVEKVEPKTERGLMYGYLEGFESIGSEATRKKSKNKKDKKNSKKEFETAPDSKILNDMTKAYQKAYHSFPNHPKYDALCQEMFPESLWEGDHPLYENKHLVFVRRIPSVNELTQRVNRIYDDLFAEKIASAWRFENEEKERWKAENYSRNYYENLVKRRTTVEVDEGDALVDIEVEQDSDNKEPEDQVDEKYYSSVMSLFIDKDEKDGEVAATHATLFRKKFKNRNSPFVLFFRPAVDYHTKPYEFAYRRKSDNKIYYKFAGERARADSEVAKDDMSFLANLCGGHWSNDEYEVVKDIGQMPSLFSLVYEILDEEYLRIIEGWQSGNLNSYEIAEAFSNYFENGVLYASSALIELYAWYIEIEPKFSRTNAVGNYRMFVDLVRRNLPQSLLYRYVKDAIISFQPLVEKLVSKSMADWSFRWSIFTNLQSPAFFASGDIAPSSRKRLIHGFNSPFFPNVIVSTSVFQEGVNLHLNCKKVHHYGIAWTPGDNEQRVGRVDRLFGCINRVLLDRGEGELHASYPYLKNTFDQEQIATFINVKFENENLLDKCDNRGESKEIKLLDSEEQWHKNLRRPESHEEVRVREDPYPFRSVCLNTSRDLYKPVPFCYEEELRGYLRSLISGILYDDEKLHEVSSGDGRSLFFVDPIIRREGLEYSRAQPVQIERNFSSEFSGLIEGSAYYLTIKTPIGTKANILNPIEGGSRVNSRRDWNKAYEELYQAFDEVWNQDNYLVQIALDPEKEYSQFYVYLKVDLPIFVLGDQFQMLSKSEVELAFRQLIDCADRFEIDYFGHERDIKLKELDEYAGSKTGELEMVNGVETNLKGSQHGERWKVVKDFPQLVYLNRQTRRNMENKLKPISYENLMRAMHEYPFINIWSTDKATLDLYIYYPKGDFQVQEQRLLEKWMDFVHDRLVWG